MYTSSVLWNGRYKPQLETEHAVLDSRRSTSSSRGPIGCKLFDKDDAWDLSGY